MKRKLLILITLFTFTLGAFAQNAAQARKLLDRTARRTQGRRFRQLLHLRQQSDGNKRDTGNQRHHVQRPHTESHNMVQRQDTMDLHEIDQRGERVKAYRGQAHADEPADLPVHV